MQKGPNDMQTSYGGASYVQQLSSFVAYSYNLRGHKA